MSTGSGILVGSSMTPTSLACHRPGASGLMSQSFEVSAVAVIAQLSPVLERPADLQRRAGDAQHLLRLHRLEVPDDHGVAEALHGLGVLHQLAEIPHVVLPPGEARGQHDVLLRVDRDVVAVAVAAVGGRHRIGGDQLALVAVERHPGHAAAVLGVRQALDDHPAGHGVERVRADVAGLGRHVGDRPHELGPRGIAPDVEDRDAAVVEAAGPEIAPVVGEAHVVRLAAARRTETLWITLP